MGCPAGTEDQCQWIVFFVEIDWLTNVYRYDHFQLDTPPSTHLNTEVLGRCWDWVLSKQILKMNVLLIMYINTLRDHGDEHALIYIILRPAVSSGLGRVAFRGGGLPPKTNGWIPQKPRVWLEKVTLFFRIEFEGINFAPKNSCFGWMFVS